MASYQHGAYASVTRGRRVFGLLLLDVCRRRRTSTGTLAYGHDIDREGYLVYHLHVGVVLLLSCRLLLCVEAGTALLHMGPRCEVIRDD